MRKPRQREYSHRCESSFPCRPCCAFCSALRRAGAAPEGSEGYPSELRAAVHSRRAGNNLGYAMLPRLFPLYRLFIFFVMDELKSAHLFRLADFYFIVIFSWRLSSFFLGDYRHFFLEIIVVETLPFNTPSNRLGLLTLISLAAA